MLKGVLQYQFGGLRDAWKDGWAAEVRRCAAAFCLLILLSFAFFLAFPDLLDRLMGSVLGWFSSADILDGSGALSVPALFSNNLRAMAFTMIYGLIPFVQLPALALGMNAILLGALAAYYAANGLSLAVFLAALLPHGIFEFPSMVLALSMGLYVCGQLTRRCRRDKTALGLWDCLVLISRLLLLVLIPLLLAAALMEAYVTPWAASLFL